MRVRQPSTCVHATQELGHRLSNRRTIQPNTGLRWWDVWLPGYWFPSQIHLRTCPTFHRWRPLQYPLSSKFAIQWSWKTYHWSNIRGLASVWVSSYNILNPSHFNALQGTSGMELNSPGIIGTSWPVDLSLSLECKLALVLIPNQLLTSVNS